jgi:DNA-binding MurR/RpiR family transcriptional regulator
MDVTNESKPALHERVIALEGQLAPGERTVARFLSDHPDLVAASTALELAERIGTSNATVIRTVKALGYSGLPALRRVMVQAMADRHDPARILNQRIDRLEANEPAEESIPHQMLQRTVELMQQAHRLVDQAAWLRATEIIEAARTVVVYGVEQPGHVADILAIELSRCGQPARALTDTGISITTGLITMSSEDALVVFAPIRHFREIDIVVDHAQSLGVPIILVSEALGMSFQDRVDVVLSTPQTTQGLASELIVPLVLAKALALDIASRNRATAMKVYEEVEHLRASVVGGDLDVDVPPPLPARLPTE